MLTPERERERERESESVCGWECSLVWEEFCLVSLVLACAFSAILSVETRAILGVRNSQVHRAYHMIS